MGALAGAPEDEPNSVDGLGGRLRRLAREALAGLIAAIVAIPDGLAAAAMVGVNPVFGLYTSAIAPTLGGLLTSTQRMQIAATSASALTASEALAPYAANVRGDALILLVATLRECGEVSYRGRPWKRILAQAGEASFRRYGFVRHRRRLKSRRSQIRVPAGVTYVSLDLTVDAQAAAPAPLEAMLPDPTKASAS